MPRRTVREAERWLQEQAPRLNPEHYRQLSVEVEDAKARAETFAAGLIEDRIALDVEPVRQELERELCQIRDDYAQLKKEGARGLLTAKEYQDRWQGLEVRQRAAARQVDRVEKAAEAISQIEEDPVGYADEVATRTMPTLMSDFSF